MSTTTHVLKPRPSLRAFGIGAVLALVGMGFVVAPDVFGWPPIVRAIGIGFLVIGLLVSGIAAFAVRRLRVEVVLDEGGYRVVGPLRTTAGTWSDVARVARARQQVILYDRGGNPSAISLPRGGAGDLDALGADIARRLDASRGYGSTQLFPAGPDPSG